MKPGSPKCIVVSGPSGVGKSVLVKTALAWAGRALPDRLALSVSHTTRPPRGGERDGEHYYFVDCRRFAAMDAAGDFLEQTSIYGNRYGTSRRYVEKQLQEGRHVLLELDTRGAGLMREKFAERSYSIFVLPPCQETLRERLTARAQDDGDEIRRRMAGAQAELAQAPHFDARLVNDDLDEARRQLVAILEEALLERAP